MINSVFLHYPMLFHYNLYPMESDEVSERVSDKRLRVSETVSDRVPRIEPKDRAKQTWHWVSPPSHHLQPLSLEVSMSFAMPSGRSSSNATGSRAKENMMKL